VGFAVCAGVGVGDISCFLERFLNRLEKMMLGFGHMPSSQDPFPCTERPHLALVVLSSLRFGECCNRKGGRRSLDAIPTQAEEYLEVKHVSHNLTYKLILYVIEMHQENEIQQLLKKSQLTCTNIGDRSLKQMMYMCV